LWSYTSISQYAFMAVNTELLHRVVQWLDTKCLHLQGSSFASVVHISISNKILMWFYTLGLMFAHRRGLWLPLK